MEFQSILKIVAVMAVLFVGYKLWENSHKKEKFVNDGSEYDEEYDEVYDEEDDEVYDESDDIYDEEDEEDEAYDDSADEETSDKLPKDLKTMVPLLTPSSQLLPKPDVKNDDFAQFAPKTLEAQNFLTATQWVGVNTMGSSLKNASYDLRANPFIPKKDVGPFYQSTIDANIQAKQLF